MFYLSIENCPKLTTKIGVITITGDCTNFNKYMYLCLKESIIRIKFIKKKKKYDFIQTKERRHIGLQPKTFSIQHCSQQGFDEGWILWVKEIWCSCHLGCTTAKGCGAYLVSFASNTLSKPHITQRSIQLLSRKKRSYLMQKFKNKEENLLLAVLVS